MTSLNSKFPIPNLLGFISVKRLIPALAMAGLMLALSVSVVLAKVGVGVGLGKVNIDEALSPGGIYKLPTLPVLNTGDEDGEYEVEITYLSEQNELRPEGDWFSFSPQSFSLSAGDSQQVDMSLTLPVDTRPGDYFAFIEAHPVASGEGVTIGVAAATKLNFTVKPSGVLGAAVERVRSLIEANAPTSYYVLGLAGGVVLIVLVRRNLNISVGLKKPDDKSSEQDKQDKGEA